MTKLLAITIFVDRIFKFTIIYSEEKNLYHMKYCVNTGRFGGCVIFRLIWIISKKHDFENDSVASNFISHFSHGYCLFQSWKTVSYERK